MQCYIIYSFRTPLNQTSTEYSNQMDFPAFILNESYDSTKDVFVKISDIL